MRRQFKKFLDRFYLPKWIIFFTDMAVVAFSFMFSYFLRFNLVSNAVDISRMLSQLAVVIPVFTLSAYIIKPYYGILRHSSISDAMMVIKSHSLGTLGLVALAFTGLRFTVPIFQIPLSIIIAQYFISVFIMIGIRYSITYVYHNLIRRPVNEQNVMIFGAGSLGIITKGVIEKDANLRINLVGFIDDNPAYHQKKMDGLMVYSAEEAFRKIVDEKLVKEIIISITPSKLSRQRKSELVDLCISKNVRVKEVPEATSWFNGIFFANQIHDVMIEDLLGRDPIRLDNPTVIRGISGKKVLVTGAAGSIGSEIVRQLQGIYPESLWLLDQAESALYDLYNEIKAYNKEASIQVIVADVTDRYRLRQLFEMHTPDIVFHAAAYKHVPMMEENPYEALRNNVGGTKVLADLSLEFGVKKFIMVSTDKAVNPTNVMGASKRICEMYVHSLSRHSGCNTQFIITRFGNVLGSNGSVIPLFRRQISLGGPVTVTDREIIRYFMTIPEACQLVFEAGFMGEGGEIFLFDMGKPVRIYDLAEKMIRLSGFIP
ncbi:MAG TPA: nucleoside-diphosphate sugar epimerase/dehydratase, partial [Prolixibacteraceae bacterium]|nr:nucleoside-diphosphate sugar epimerase/dehydratase [Prolixibacteraceae bacterium]